MVKSLLLLGKGDTPYTDRNLRRLFGYAKMEGMEVERKDYNEIRNAPTFSSETINIVLFFPYTFWNDNCELPTDTKLYGTSRSSYGLFKEFLLETEKNLEKIYSGKRLNYIISPPSAALDRDKIATLQLLEEHGVSAPKLFSSHKLEEILAALSLERGLFIKCRYGAEGKGITLLREDKWVTNYKVDGDRLANYGIYGHWKFTDITGRTGLLEQLLEQEVIVEREIIVPNLFSGKKFDVRAYVVKGTVSHFFLRVNELHKVVTNYSQGGQVIHHPETGLPVEFIKQIKKEAVGAAGAFSSKFLGVDVMFDSQILDDHTAKVVEVQAFTEFPDIKHFDLARHLLSCGLFS